MTSPEPTIEFIEIDDVIADPKGVKLRQRRALKRTAIEHALNEESSECQSISEGPFVPFNIKRVDQGPLESLTPKTPSKRMKLINIEAAP